MTFLKISIWTLIVLVANCTPKKRISKICSAKDNVGTCIRVSFDSLFIAPDEFNDKCIQLEGYLVLGFEQVGLFRSEKRIFSKGAVWLKMENDVAQQILKNFPKGIPGKISVAGVFNRTKDRFGYFGELDQKGCIEIK